MHTPDAARAAPRDAVGDPRNYERLGGAFDEKNSGIEINGQRGKFKIEPFEEIRGDTGEEWLVKRILPRRGVGAIYGKPGSFKSFIALDVGFSVALGERWAGRRVTQGAVVYICAEGAHGFRKRIEGLRQARGTFPRTPLYLISAAPNLGSEKGDLDDLIASVTSAGIAPGLIVIDTLARSLGSADENGVGMVQFVSNAAELAGRFAALVLVVHHSGLGDDRRMRGHSSLNGALDAVILCERDEGELAASLTLQKSKDEASDIRLSARLSRLVLGRDEDGESISTLVVDAIEAGKPTAEKLRQRKVPPSQRLLMDVTAKAIDEAGEPVKLSDGTLVMGVADEIVRERFYEHIAEQAEPGEDPTGKKLAERQRKAFNRAVEAALKAKFMLAMERDGTRFLIPPGRDGTLGTPPKGGVSRPVPPIPPGQGKMSRNVPVCPVDENPPETGEFSSSSGTAGGTNTPLRENCQATGKSGVQKNENVPLERGCRASVEAANDEFVEGEL